MSDKNSVGGTLGEVMGEGFEHRSKLSLDDLPKILGPKMPHLPFDRVGKIRLVNAMHQRFGPGWQNVPGVKDIMDHFDRNMQTETIVRMNRRAQK